MFKNSQWPECERHKHFIHNKCNWLFMLAKIMPIYIYNNHLSAMVNSHWYQQTHTFIIQGTKYSILDVHSPLSKHSVGCSNGSEIPAFTEVVTLEIDVFTTNA